MSYTEDHITLAELNRLEPGLGDRIQHLLNANKSHAQNERAKQLIGNALEKHDLEMSDVYIEKGLASGMTLDQAFQTASATYQFQDQFDV